MGRDSAVLDGLSGTGRIPAWWFWDWAVLGGTRRTFVKFSLHRSVAESVDDHETPGHGAR